MQGRAWGILNTTLEKLNPLFSEVHWEDQNVKQEIEIIKLF